MVQQLMLTQKGSTPICSQQYQQDYDLILSYWVNFHYSE